MNTEASSLTHDVTPIPQGAGPYTERERHNKQVAVAFYKLAINDKDVDAALAFAGPYYKQHNPMAPDGREGLRKFVEQLRATKPTMKVDVRQAFVDGDFVILNVHVTRDGEPNLAIAEIFRLEDGLVVEHWDRIQPIPDEANNENTMF